MTRTHSKSNCFWCGQRVSTNGLAQVSHKRKHVREGLLVELARFGYPCIFVRPKDAEKMMATGYYRRRKNAE